MPKAPNPYLSAAAIGALEELERGHPLNAQAVRHQRSLGDEVGLKHLGVHLVRIPPGSASSEVHTHQCEEEFVYVLSGQGEAEVGDGTVPLGPGDFLGFTAQSAPHTLRNPGGEDLLCLVGGQRLPFDVVDYPHKAVRLFKVNGARQYVRQDAVHAGPPPGT